MQAREAESKLKEVQDFAKAELAALIAREKAAQIEKMAEANLNVSNYTAIVSMFASMIQLLTNQCEGSF